MIFSQIITIEQFGRLDICLWSPFRNSGGHVCQWTYDGRLPSSTTTSTFTCHITCYILICV